MIVYELRCNDDHRFEGWFASADDFERQCQDKSLTCPVCGDAAITRLPHAPYVNTRGAESRPARSKTKLAAARQYANLDGEALSRMIEHVIENTEDVGSRFPEEARKIHYNEAPERHIRGTASKREVESLKEEGIEVVALPVPPHLAGTQH